jgi:carbon-monoxide dehydrogenase medium subunit
VLVRSLKGERRIPAHSFFTGLYTTDLAPDEVIVACEVPCAQPEQRFAFIELARRHGDYAAVGLAAAATLQEGLVAQARLAWLGVGVTPLRSPDVEQALLGQPLTEKTLARAVQVLRDELEPLADLTHSQAAKRQLAGVLLKRALQGMVTSAPAGSPLGRAPQNSSSGSP